MEHVQTDKWHFTDVTQLKSQWWNPAALIGVLKKKPKTQSNHAAALRVWQADALPLAMAWVQTRTDLYRNVPVACRCLSDGQAASCGVCAPAPPLEPTSLVAPTRNGGQTERVLSFQTTVPRKQYLSPPPPNILSQLARLTYIPNSRVHVCI